MQVIRDKDRVIETSDKNSKFALFCVKKKHSETQNIKQSESIARYVRQKRATKRKKEAKPAINNQKETM